MYSKEPPTLSDITMWYITHRLLRSSVTIGDVVDTPMPLLARTTAEIITKSITRKTSELLKERKIVPTRQSHEQSSKNGRAGVISKQTGGDALDVSIEFKLQLMAGLASLASETAKLTELKPE
jgi:hypothetical protein